MSSITASGDFWLCAGDFTNRSAQSLLEQSRPLKLPANGVIDLSKVEHADSSALSLMISWTRRARREGRSLHFQSVPQTLDTLAKLYGVDTLLKFSVRS